MGKKLGKTEQIFPRLGRKEDFLGYDWDICGQTHNSCFSRLAMVVRRTRALVCSSYRSHS